MPEARTQVLFKIKEAGIVARRLVRLQFEVAITVLLLACTGTQKVDRSRASQDALSTGSDSTTLSPESRVWSDKLDGSTARQEAPPTSSDPTTVSPDNRSWIESACA